jgi:hypothetical protein
LAIARRDPVRTQSKIIKKKNVAQTSFVLFFFDTEGSPIHISSERTGERFHSHDSLFRPCAQAVVRISKDEFDGDHHLTVIDERSCASRVGYPYAVSACFQRRRTNWNG